MSDQWPDWGENATKGDLIQLAIKQRSMNVLLLKTLSSLIAGNKDQAMRDFGAALKGDDAINELIDGLGGRK